MLKPHGKLFVENLYDAILMESLSLKEKNNRKYIHDYKSFLKNFKRFQFVARYILRYFSLRPTIYFQMN